MAEPIWVTVVTGFLGSGKTTVLNRLLASPELDGAMVIVNEFGEVGIDSDLMIGAGDQVVQLENGCLCCTVKSDLIDTFRDLSIRRRAGTLPPFRRVVIETTGIADPGPVLQIILTNPMVRNAYALDGVVTTLDAINGAQTLASFPESVRQVATADRVLLTKLDLVPEAERAARVAEATVAVRTLNPAAPVIEAVKGDIDTSQLFGMGLYDPATGRPDVARWIDPALYEGTAPDTRAVTAAPKLDDDAIAAAYAAQGHRVTEADAEGTEENAPHHHHGSDIRSFCVTREEPVSLDTLRLFLEALQRQAGPRLLRVKGLVATRERPEQPAIIQGAQQIFHSLDWLPAWPSSDRRTRIVFITKGLERAEIEDDLALIERLVARTERAKARAAG